MKQIGLLLALAPMLPAAAQASSLEYAVETTDGTPARLNLIDHEEMSGAAPAEDAWRISPDPTTATDADDGDFRLKIKVRPNRAMGRMSVAF